jgi:hypothetical protein
MNPVRLRSVSLRRWLGIIVAAAVTMSVLLALPRPASADREYTRGFAVMNNTDDTLALKTVRGFPWGIAGPKAGTSILPHERQRFELTFRFFDFNIGDLIYDIRGTHDTFRANLAVGTLGDPSSECFVPPQYRCTADGGLANSSNPNLVTFDPGY